MGTLGASIGIRTSCTVVKRYITFLTLGFLPIVFYKRITFDTLLTSILITFLTTLLSDTVKASSILMEVKVTFTFMTDFSIAFGALLSVCQSAGDTNGFVLNVLILHVSVFANITYVNFIAGFACNSKSLETVVAHTVQSVISI